MLLLPGWQSTRINIKMRELNETEAVHLLIYFLFLSTCRRFSLDFVLLTPVISNWFRITNLRFFHRFSLPGSIVSICCIHDNSSLNFKHSLFVGLFCLQKIVYSHICLAVFRFSMTFNANRFYHPHHCVEMQLFMDPLISLSLSLSRTAMNLNCDMLNQMKFNVCFLNHCTIHSCWSIATRYFGRSCSYYLCMNFFGKRILTILNVSSPRFSLFRRFFCSFFWKWFVFFLFMVSFQFFSICWDEKKTENEIGQHAKKRRNRRQKYRQIFVHRIQKFQTGCNKLRKQNSSELRKSASVQLGVRNTTAKSNDINMKR